MSARCINDTNGDGDCAACARNPQAPCRQTARETLTTTLTNLLARTRNGRMDVHRAEAERLVDEALKEGAHELAERQRAHDGVEPDDYRQPQAWREGYSDGLQDGADLIDPEVTDA